MVGATAAGKTSLVRQFTYGVYSEQYETTIGVNIKEKDVAANGRPVKLIIWDLEGYDDHLQKYTKESLDADGYITGSHGYVLVVDGTRPDTLNVARSRKQEAQRILGDAVPFVAMLNKCDLEEKWALNSGMWDELSQEGWTVYETSAKTGKNVVEAFQSLVRKMLEIDQLLIIQAADDSEF